MNRTLAKNLEEAETPLSVPKDIWNDTPQERLQHHRGTNDTLMTTLPLSAVCGVAGRSGVSRQETARAVARPTRRPRADHELMMAHVNPYPTAAQLALRVQENDRLQTMIRTHKDQRRQPRQLKPIDPLLRRVLLPGRLKSLE